jgi:hypothetical protein
VSKYLTKDISGHTFFRSFSARHFIRGTWEPSLFWKNVVRKKSGKRCGPKSREQNSKRLGAIEQEHPLLTLVAQEHLDVLGHIDLASIGRSM